MTDTKTLEKKISALEERLKKVEDMIALSADAKDVVYMDALYTKAKELVVKYQKSSIWFLQRKLLIDFERAKRLREQLKTEGVIRSI